MPMNRGTVQGHGARPRLRRLAAFVTGYREAEMKSRRAGRILAAILLAGLFAAPWAGQVALLVAALIAAGVMLVWIVLDAATEIGDEAGRRPWRSRVTIALEYSVLGLVAGAALVGFGRALPAPFGAVADGAVLRGLVLVWVAFTWFAPWLLAARAESVAARRRLALGALAAAGVGLVLLVVVSDGRARTVDVVMGGALILVSASYTLRGPLFPQ